MASVTVPLTKVMKIVIAALQLEERNVIPFSEHDLILESWKRWPETFGLKSASKEFPCSKTVMDCLQGHRGLIARTYIKRSPSGVGFTLTTDGRELAYEVAEAHNLTLGRRPANPAPLNGITPTENAFLHRVLQSEAVHQAAQKRFVNISFRDAMTFWDLAVDDFGSDLINKFVAFEKSVRYVEETLNGLKGQDIVLDDGRAVSWKELALIKETDTEAKSMYRTQINVVSKRPALNR